MASYRDLRAAEQMWPSPLAFPDALTEESEAFAGALPGTFAGDDSFTGAVFSPGILEFWNEKSDASPIQTPPASAGWEVEVRSAFSEQRRSALPTGRVNKHNSSRSTKHAARKTTTFIAADPLEFRRMVQQVTGAGFGGQDGDQPVLNPERYNTLELPTLDTSSFLLDVAGGSGAAVARAERSYVEPFLSFPTLESWKATE